MATPSSYENRHDGVLVDGDWLKAQATWRRSKVRGGPGRRYGEDGMVAE